MWWRSRTGPPVDWMRMLHDLRCGSSSAQKRAFIAFSRIIEERLVRIGAHRYLDSCEDIVHDVIMSLLAHADSVREPAAWVRRTAHNEYVSWIRRESNRRRKVESHVRPSMIARVVEPLIDEAVLTKEDLRLLHDAIDRLTPPLRSAIDAVFPNDPSREPPTLANAADDLRIRETTLKNRLRKAICELGRDIRRQRALGRFQVGSGVGTGCAAGDRRGDRPSETAASEPTASERARSERADPPVADCEATQCGVHIAHAPARKRVKDEAR